MLRFARRARSRSEAPARRPAVRGSVGVFALAMLLCVLGGPWCSRTAHAEQAVAAPSARISVPAAAAAPAERTAPAAPGC
ncbi:hypothetical protein, partial [Streptomyces beihaiensis]